MKKIYSLIIASAFTLFSLNAKAAPVNIVVGFNGSAFANSFFPVAVTANVGDVLTFTLASGTHNVTSTSVPAGAAAIASPTMSVAGTSYNYTVTVAGTYAYFCSIHGSGMSGTATVSGAAGIAAPIVDFSTTAYPNPFKEKLTLKYNAIESIELFNIVGDKVKTFELPSTETKTEIDLSDLSAGVYFIRTYKEGTVVETKKIVKSK